MAKLPTITGYAAVFFNPADYSTRGTAADGAELRVSPTAFRYELGKRRVVCQYDHRPDRTFAREADGTLRLAVDARGLRFWATPPDTPFARRLVWKIEAGEVSGASFQYHVDGRTEARDGGRLVRDLWDVTLLEVGPVRHPGTPGACCWIKQPNADLDEFARLAAVMKNLERQEAQ